MLAQCLEEQTFKRFHPASKNIISELYATVLEGKIKTRMCLEHYLTSVMLNNVAKRQTYSIFREQNPFGKGVKCRLVMTDVVTFINSRSSHIMIRSVSTQISHESNSVSPTTRVKITL